MYIAGVSLPAPADIPLSDEDGCKLVELICARPWTLPRAGELMAGWMVAALLGGSLAICPHVWINAPARTGKTYMKKDIASVLGAYAVQLENVPTEASVRQKRAGDALPVLNDEVEPGENNLEKINKLLELMRSASYGGVISKGSPDGTARDFFIKCSFALFSISNCISRDADATRCLELSLQRLSNDRMQTLWKRQETGRQVVNLPGFHERLISRLLALLPVIKENTSDLQAYLVEAGADARRAELFAVLLACRHALVNRERMNQEAMQEAAALMLAYGEQEEKESDFARCLNHLVNIYQIEVHGAGKMNVASACKMLKNCAAGEQRDAINRALSLAGLRWCDAGLQVDKRADKMKRIYAGTQWSNGKITPILAEGCGNKKGIENANAAGIWLRSAKLGGLTPTDCIMIPSAMVLGDD